MPKNKYNTIFEDKRIFFSCELLIFLVIITWTWIQNPDLDQDPDSLKRLASDLDSKKEYISTLVRQPSDLFADYLGVLKFLSDLVSTISRGIRFLI